MSNQTKINDGGPVFPQPNEQRYLDPVHGVIRPSDIYGPAPSGIKLRDYFAGQALAGICGDGIPGNHHWPANVVRDAYELADLMLAEREKGSV